MKWIYGPSNGAVKTGVIKSDVNLVSFITACLGSSAVAYYRG